jgi:hypothetical protein
MAKDILPPTVIEALEAGNKIEAIKRLRAITGQGLKESKDWIDSYERSGGEEVREFDRPDGGEPAKARFAAHQPAAPAPISRPGLGPGEVPRGSGPGKWFALIMIGLVAVLAALYFRR